MTTPEDAELLRAVARGDPAAAERLVRRFEAPLYRFLLRATGSAAMAEEARQLAFLRALSRARGHRGGSVRAWLFRMGWRVAQNLHRHETRHAHDPLEPQAAIADAGEFPPDRVARKEEQERVRRALERLVPQDRALLWLRVTEGLPLTEIGRVLAVPPSTLRDRLPRALKRLRQELEHRPTRHHGESHALP